MKSLILNHKINSFLKMKENEMPEFKRKSVDQLIEDLVSEGRQLSSY